MSPRLLALSLLAVLAGCSGSSSPPPPVATATPSQTANDLRPMSSRDGAAAPASAPTAAPAPAEPTASLPPGHPPLEGGGAPAPSPTLPAGHPAIQGGAPAPGALPAGHPPIGETAPGARSAGTIAGTIALSPKLKANATDVLYVMAKKGTATLAVRRVDKPSFPFQFEISGGAVMMGGGGFEGSVDVVARLSRTGDAIPTKGDLEGVAKNVKVPSKAVKLTIDTVR